MPVDEEMRSLVASKGSIPRVAKAIGESEATLKAWLGGRFRPHPDRRAAVMARIEQLDYANVGDGRRRLETEPA